jgi:hypothetical protein
MTALKPIENRRVVAVAAETYPMNAVCAHPDCTNEVADPHHSFPRSAIGGDSYFVSITFDSWEDAVAVLGKNPSVTEVLGVGFVSAPIPHCIGLCREHHDNVEAHLSWCKLESGTWVWLDLDNIDPEQLGVPDTYVEIGELNPQPGATKSKAKRSRLKGEARRKRRTISIRVPDDAENGGEVWDEHLERVRSKLIDMELYSEADKIPVYEATIAAWHDWLLS